MICLSSSGESTQNILCMDELNKRLRRSQYRYPSQAPTLQRLYPGVPNSRGVRKNGVVGYLFKIKQTGGAARFVILIMGRDIKLRNILIIVP